MKRWIAVLFLVSSTLDAQELISEAQFKTLLSQNPAVVVFDVRTAEEFATGHLAVAKLLPFDAINAVAAAKVIASKNTPVVVYCRSGRRSAIAAQTLKGLGFTQVKDFGGVGNWTGKLVK